jgi:hypothetical protein
LTSRRIAQGLLLLAAGAAGCNWLFGLDELSNGKCPEGLKACPEQDECVRPDSPETGCGRPGCAPCTVPHGFAECDLNNECRKVSCQKGWEDCFPDPVEGPNGCETDTAHDPNHCGGCNEPACTAPPYAYPDCRAGQCTSGGCLTGHTDCDGDLADLNGNGCETEVASPAECPLPAGQ